MDVEGFLKDSVNAVFGELRKDGRGYGGRDHDTPKGLGVGVTKQLDDLETTQTGHHQVEENDRVLLRGNLLHRDLTINGQIDIETIPLQNGRDQSSNLVVIVNDQCSESGQYSPCQARETSSATKRRGTIE